MISMLSANETDCAELSVAHQQAERAHMHAWQRLATYREALGADADPGGLSPTERARLKQLADESAATARAWTQAFATWWRTCACTNSS
jgi:hypothetical protein